jgi:uncharacterized membrane protein YkoI
MRFKSSTILIGLLVLALCCAVVAVGFAEKGDQDQKLTIEQLPPAVRATLQAQAQGNPIQDIEKETEDGVTFYSADIIQGDKKLGVEIAENGQLLNSEPEAIKSEKEESGEENEAAEADEVEVSFDQLPPAVQATLKAEVGAGTIDGIEKDTKDGADVYSADVTKADGQKYDIEIAADGKLINSELEKDKGSCKKECGSKEEEEEESDGDSD